MKKAILNDGYNEIEYNSLDELERRLPSPYTEFSPIAEFEGLLIGRCNVSFGRYVEVPDNESGVSNLDDTLV